MKKFAYLAAEVKVYGLYGAQVRAWAPAGRRPPDGVLGVLFRSTAPHGRMQDWPDTGYAWVGRDDAAAFFRAFADAVEDACRGLGTVDVVSDCGDPAPEAGVHDDGWTPSCLHIPHPAADLVAKLAADGGRRLVAVRSWRRTISPAREHYTRNSVLCVLGAWQAELLAESLRRFAEM